MKAAVRAASTTPATRSYQVIFVGNEEWIADNMGNPLYPIDGDLTKPWNPL